MILIFNGPPAAGKDTAANFFIEKYGFEHRSFKDALFKETINYFGVDENWFMVSYNDRDTKSKPEESLGGLNRREAMIHVSESVIKPKHGSSYFGDRTADSMGYNIDYAISDGGFIDELMSIINKFGIDNILVIQLTKDGCDFSKDSRRYFNGELVREYVINKRSEFHEKYMIINKIPVRVCRIHNNGSVEQLYNVLRDIYEKEQHENEERNIKDLY